MLDGEAYGWAAPVAALLLAVGARAQPAQSPPSVASSPDTTPAAVVREYLRAYNAHDIEATLAVLAPDFVWLSVAGDSVTVEARGIAAIRAQLTDYFRALPSARSDVADLTVLGPWVSATELARWTDRAGQLRAQASHSVYEVRGGRLRRVWYYPVVRP